jgi:nitric oxide reductase activation protein
MLSKLEDLVACTQLKGVSFPNEDYTRYVRSRALVKGTSRRLLDSLRVAQDALDEDPRKIYGELDLAEVVQMMTTGQPREDVFKRDEYLSRSYAWSVLFDVSASMRVKGEYGRALAICVAESTKELLMDPGSWTFFAFSDQLYVVKDAAEAYSRKVRARIGGLNFSGLTYMPDAIQVAGKVLSQRFDEQRFLIVISDGWPCGYPGVSAALLESIRALEKKGIIVIGVGLETERMKEYFRYNAAVYNQRDLIKAFARIYVRASASALES